MLGKENLASFIINYNHTVTQLVHMINHTYICHVCMYLEGLYSCSMHSMYLGSMYVHVRLYQGTCTTCMWYTCTYIHVHTHDMCTRSTYILHVLQLHIYIDVPLCSWLSLLLLLLLLLAFATLTTITTFLLLFGITSTSTSTSTLHGHVIHPLCELVFFNRP